MSAQGVISSDDVIAAQHGDESAFNRLVAASRNTIASIALAITRDLDASEEITQQVFINFWQKLHTTTWPGIRDSYNRKIIGKILKI